MQSLRAHIPNLPDHLFRSAIFELDPSGHLLNDKRSINPHDLTSSAVELLPEEPIPLSVNGVQQPPITDGPLMREGNGYTFVYEKRSNALLAVWGPGISLHPLGHGSHPAVFVNTYHTDSANLNVAEDDHFTELCGPGDGPARMHSEHVKQSGKLDLEEKSDELAPIKQSTRVPQVFRQKQIFDIVLVFDNSFCALYKNQHRRAVSAIRSMIKKVSQVINPTVANVRPSSIEGYCNSPTDPFGRPSELDDCPLNSTLCSRSSIVLNKLRQFWRLKPQYDSRDALYLFTGYDAGNNVEGAAFRGAACNVDYAYGWVHGASYVVLAHEVGHTLGAPHDTTGLMAPFIDKDDMDPALSEKSIKDINSFVSSVRDTWCLSSFDRYYVHGDTTLVGLKVKHERMEATDVTFSDISKPGNTDLLILLVGLRNTSDFLYFSITENVRKDSSRTYAIDRWNGLFPIPSTEGDHRSGGGIAFGNIRSPKSADIIVAYVSRRRRIFFKAGFGLEIDGSATGGWSPSYEVNAPLPKLIVCIGITIGNVSGKGKNDLVISYVNINSRVHYASYIVGFNLGIDGAPQDGWSEIMPIPGWVGYAAGDISVSLYDTNSNGQMDLIVHTNEKALSMWRGSFRIGRDVNNEGAVTGLWSSTIPAPGSPLIAAMPRLTGGIAVGNIKGSDKPTTVILQSVSILERSNVVSYLELGFDLLQSAKAEVNISSIKNVRRSPSSQCQVCYSGALVKTCKEEFELCNLSEFAYPIETVTMVMARSSLRQDLGDGLRDTDEPTIFCEGFYDLYIESESGACEVNAGTEDIVTAGAARIIREEVEANLQGDDSIVVEYRIEFAPLEGSLIVEEKNINSGPLRRPQSVKVTIRSESDIRKDIIREALNKLKARRDFSGAFVESGDTRIQKIGKRQYLVVLFFTERFKREYYKSDSLKRIAE